LASSTCPDRDQYGERTTSTVVDRTAPPRHGITGTHRLQICLLQIAGDDRACRSIHGFGARRDGSRVRCFTRNGHDWADRFPAIVDAASRIQASSFLIDGEAVIARDDGTPDFHALRSKRRGIEAMVYAFDLIELDSEDLRAWPLLARKRWLAKLIGKAQRRAIRFSEHLRGDGPTVFEHVCRMGMEGVVSKRVDTPYRSGPSKVWVKTKNPASDTVRREREEEWR
jgi:bifunctional non-homologous end joining protein LigD